MRILIKDSISNWDLQCFTSNLQKEQRINYTKRKMSNSLAEYLFENSNRLIQEISDGEGGLLLKANLEILSDIERDRIYREANSQAKSTAYSTVPTFIDDFGNEIPNKSFEDKIYNSFRRHHD